MTQKLGVTDHDMKRDAMSKPLNRSFFSRFNKIISLVYGTITISAAVLFSFLYSDNYEANVQSINLRLLEQTRAFNSILRVRYDAVKAMQRQARKFLRHDLTLYEQNLNTKDIVNRDMFFQAIRSGEDAPYGMILGKGTTQGLTGEKKSELQMVLALMPLVNVLKNQIQSVVSFHYTSANDFYFVYPWSEYEDILFDASIYQREYYQRSKPANNREDRVFWTDVLVPSSTQQPQITCAAPVYKNQEYKGVVGIDFTLESVDFFMENIHYQFGHFLIVNDFGTVIADIGGQKSITNLKESFTSMIPADLDLDLNMFKEEGVLTQVNNYWVYVASTSFAPWKIVFYVKNDEITYETLKQILPGLLLVLLFTTLFLIGANRLIAREFIEPAKLLVDHILSKGTVAYKSEQNIREPWTEWFQVVETVFAENKALVDRLEKHIDRLDEKVVQRTNDLQRNNRQLKKALDELKKAQNQIITQEKLAGLGALTAGIAHEIRNPLNFIINFAETSRIFGDEIQDSVNGELENVNENARQNLLDLVQQLSSNMTKIEEHGRRADAIVHSMLLHARGGDDQLKEIEIHELLEENILLGLASFKQKGFTPKLTKTLDANLDLVTAYPQDLGRVFLNIINNACYALHEKSNAADDFQPELNVETIDHKNMFEIRIRDNGPGIPKSVKRKIFNPFFTTKPSGEGTGLGLSLCFDIVVNQHGGNFDLETKEGEYTEFIITLPKITKKMIVTE